ncbi:hypothetical protein BN9982_460002 [Mycobacterium tuberculosis]|nr:hypothetical protein BN9982_460002 [Mycobacterium tuberculosis]
MKRCSGYGSGAHGDKRDVGGGHGSLAAAQLSALALDPPGIPHSGPDAESSIPQPQAAH